jgi:hypothetical protein
MAVPAAVTVDTPHADNRTSLGRERVVRQDDRPTFLGPRRVR